MSIRNYPNALLDPIAASSVGAAAAWSGARLHEPQGAQPDFRVGTSATGVIQDVVVIDGKPQTAVARRVRLYRVRDGMLVGETWSAEGTGIYRFERLERDHTYIPVALDHTGVFAAIATGPVTPTFTDSAP